MNKYEAIKIAENKRSGMKAVSVFEKQKCFVVIMSPEQSRIKNYMAGATRIDKKTGEVSLFNPMLER